MIKYVVLVMGLILFTNSLWFFLIVPLLFFRPIEYFYGHPIFFMAPDIFRDHLTPITAIHLLYAKLRMISL